MSDNYEACNQCGDDSIDFREGVCIGCANDNQRELDEHNKSYSRWQGMTYQQRNDAIRKASE